MARRRKDGFNNPFAGLDQLVSRKEAEARKKAAAEPEPEPEPEPEETGDGDALFREWVGEVKPLEPARARVDAPRPPPKDAAQLRAEEDAEALAVLSDLVAGRGAFDISDTEEHLEGLAPGIDRRLLRRLKRGDYSLQGHLDLHGMVQKTAQEEVQRFIVEARARGKRCVLIIHGRGRGSPGKEPVLKKALTRWLSRGELGKQVLAFATARPHDGGGGAMYVLLRK